MNPLKMCDIFFFVLFRGSFLDSWGVLFPTNRTLSYQISPPIGNELSHLVVGMFSFAWMIVGSVVLFRDSTLCQDPFFGLYPVWQTALACLISYYVSIVVNCITSGLAKNATKK